MRGRIFILIAGLVLFISLISANSDIAVFQGQYYEGTEFKQGTFEFKFEVYNDRTEGNLIYSQTESLTTGYWGQWRVELEGLSEACNDSSKDYFMEITIENQTQGSRKLLTHFNYMRKDIDEITSKSLTIGDKLNFIMGGFIQELVNLFIINKNLQVQGNLDVTGNIISNNKSVCLEDGTNCVSGSSSSANAPVSFISTIDGKINRNDLYLSLGTDGGVSTTDTEMSWIIDRDMTITGILWNSFTNSRTKSSAITLMRSTSEKVDLVETELIKDIQGQISGSDLNFNVNLSQGDLVAIKYISGGNGGDIEDLSITLIGHYN